MQTVLGMHPWGASAGFGVELAVACPAQHAGKQAVPHVHLPAGVLLMLLVSGVFVKSRLPLQVGLIQPQESLLP